MFLFPFCVFCLCFFFFLFFFFFHHSSSCFSFFLFFPLVFFLTFFFLFVFLVFFYIYISFIYLFSFVMFLFRLFFLFSTSIMSLCIMCKLYFPSILLLLHFHKCFCNNTYLKDKERKEMWVIFQCKCL
jgi:hypothetical protein